MKKNLLVLFLLFIAFTINAQQRFKANELVAQGVVLHDKGKYQEALNLYNQALAIDNDNLSALAESAFTFFALEQYDSALQRCKIAVIKHPYDSNLKTLYLTYGNCYDAMHQPKESVRVFDEAILRFPDFYQLYYNKGVTLAGMKKNEEAMKCFQKSAMLNPQHPGSHLGVANLSAKKNKKMPTIMSLSCFLLMEPNSGRSLENVNVLKEQLFGAPSKKKSNVIYLDIDFLHDSDENGKIIENNFSGAELSLGLMPTIMNDRKLKKMKDVEKFQFAMNMICNSLSDTSKTKAGFFWDYYAPFFVALKAQDQLETFSHIVYASTHTKDNDKWLDTHKSEITKFYEWSDNFNWYQKQQ